MPVKKMKENDKSGAWHKACHKCKI